MPAMRWDRVRDFLSSHTTDEMWERIRTLNNSRTMGETKHTLGRLLPTTKPVKRSPKWTSCCFSVTLLWAVRIASSLIFSPRLSLPLTTISAASRARTRHSRPASKRLSPRSEALRQAKCSLRCRP